MTGAWAWALGVPVYLLGFTVTGRIAGREFGGDDRTERILAGLAFGMIWPVAAAAFAGYWLLGWLFDA
jgi:hypothetical protein